MRLSRASSARLVVAVAAVLTTAVVGSATALGSTPYHSTWLDNAKAKFLLGWRPRYDLRKMADEAWSYHRAPGDPRVIWYPG